MKFQSSSLTVILFGLCIIGSLSRCKDNSSTKGNSDSTKIKANVTTKDANQLYSERMTILNKRISIQSSNTRKALELNKNAIEKFSATYKADTTFTDPVLFNSECTMFARDYVNCIYWTSILKRLDTSQRNIIFCNERIKDCNNQLKLKTK